MKKKNLLLKGFLILLLSVTCQFLNGQGQHVYWQKRIGGTGEESIFYMIKLIDGNYLSCGTTNSHNGNFNVNRGDSDAFLLKTDRLGNIIWERTYGGSYSESFYNVIETINGDIIAIGTTGSNDQQVTGHHGAVGTDDVWLVRTNKNGDLLKQHCFGGSGAESTTDLGMSEGLLISKSGNILFAAETNSNDGDVSGNHGDYDGWVVKLDSATFDIIQSKTIGNADYDALYNINEIKGHFLVTGTKATKMYSGPYHDNIEDYYKAFAAELDTSTLDTLWYRIYGGSRSDDCNASIVSSDGNLILTGHAASSDGDCLHNNGFNTWTWKINENNGSIIWRNFTGVPSDTSAAFNIIATHDGGFVAVGAILHTLNPFLADGYVVRMDAKGKTQWKKRFGGSGNDQILSGVEENDESFLLGGLTSSEDGNVSGSHVGHAISQQCHRFPVHKEETLTTDVWLVQLKSKK